MAKRPSGTGAFKHSKHTAWRKVADEAVILDVDTAHYFSLTGTGLRAWELLAGGLTAAGLTAALESEFDAPPGRIAADVADLLSHLEREGLLESA